jgi:alpha-glucosidase
VNVYDTALKQFTVPKEIISPPGTAKDAGKSKSDLEFHYNASPFAFWITRRGAPNDSAPLFDTRISSLPKTPIAPWNYDQNRTALDGFPLVFEDAYLQV